MRSQWAQSLVPGAQFWGPPSWGMSATGHSITRPRSKQFWSPKMEPPVALAQVGTPASCFWNTWGAWMEIKASFQELQMFRYCRSNVRIYKVLRRGHALTILMRDDEEWSFWAAEQPLGCSWYVVIYCGKSAGLIQYFSLDLWRQSDIMC